MPKTLFDKIWEAHVVRDLGEGWALLHIDRDILHDLSGPPSFRELMERKLPVRNPELGFATPDHAVSTAPGRSGESFPMGAKLYEALKKASGLTGIRFFDIGEEGHGIVHVMGPELGLVLPGATLVCGDSHSCTNGGLGAFAFGIGSSESSHVLATQTLRQKMPRQMRIRFDGKPGAVVSPKDMILYALARLGVDSAVGCALEFAGEAIGAMPVEGRLTVCNLSVELGAKYSLVAPDEKTFAYLKGRPYAPKGAQFDEAISAWRELFTDEGASFDREEVIDISSISPMVSWGTNPGQTIAVDAAVPDPADAKDEPTKAAYSAALDYMGLEPGMPIAEAPVDWVFIGSCANARLSDLREAAGIAKGRHVARGVTAWVVPGSELVKRAAQAEGLDRIFLDAGFEWRESGCSMCVAANGERVLPKARIVSTSNRNFVGRQGPGARTHLASPATAAASAILGRISDPRSLA
jgi:3-isopropylmalate/(R)-2-methylmalate dehydratase large subunit